MTMPNITDAELEAAEAFYNATIATLDNLLNQFNDRGWGGGSYADQVRKLIRDLVKMRKIEAETITTINARTELTDTQEANDE